MAIKRRQGGKSWQKGPEHAGLQHLASPEQSSGLILFQGAALRWVTVEEQMGPKGSWAGAGLRLSEKRQKTQLSWSGGGGGGRPAPWRRGGGGGGGGGRGSGPLGCWWGEG